MLVTRTINILATMYTINAFTSRVFRVCSGLPFVNEQSSASSLMMIVNWDVNEDDEMEIDEKTK